MPSPPRGGAPGGPGDPSRLISVTSGLSPRARGAAARGVDSLPLPTVEETVAGSPARALKYCDLIQRTGRDINAQDLAVLRAALESANTLVNSLTAERASLAQELAYARGAVLPVPGTEQGRTAPYLMRHYSGAGAGAAAAAEDAARDHDDDVDRVDNIEHLRRKYKKLKKAWERECATLVTMRAAEDARSQAQADLDHAKAAMKAKNEEHSSTLARLQGELEAALASATNANRDARDAKLVWEKREARLMEDLTAYETKLREANTKLAGAEMAATRVGGGSSKRLDAPPAADDSSPHGQQEQQQAGAAGGDVDFAHHHHHHHPHDQPDANERAMRAQLERLEALVPRGVIKQAYRAQAARQAAPTPAVHRPAPTGQVVLIFTEVMGSVALWEAAPNAMVAALDLHNTIVRQLLASYHGYEVRTEGDSFMLAFDTVMGAYEWCAEVQQALHSADWPLELAERAPAIAGEVLDSATGKTLFPRAGLRVRMGIHVGSPICTRDPVTGRMDYHGPVVYRAARIAAAASGGQILMGEAAFAKLQPKIDSLTSKVIVNYLGQHELKGLSTPESLVQVMPLTLSGRTFPGPNTVTTQKRVHELHDHHNEEAALSTLAGDPDAPNAHHHQPAAAAAEADSALETALAKVKPVPAPRGEVTLVFTDVQDSTLLWDKAPMSMADALDRHNDLARALCSKYSGYEVKTEGDAFMLAFADPVLAYEWCAAMQTGLLNLDWPADLAVFEPVMEERDPAGNLLYVRGGLRVRMGIFTGSPICNVDPVNGRMDYFGPVVNRSARVAGSAHGGQIVVGYRTFELLHQSFDRLSERPVVVDLGEHVLKGLSVPEHLMQVLPAGLSARTFAAPSTITTSGIVKETYLANLRSEHAKKMIQDAPRGNVTLVFTDVQGSTALWEADPTNMCIALEQHNELMRRLLHEHRGYEVKTEGDAFMIAFHSSLDAVGFCVAVQRALLEVAWPPQLLRLPSAERTIDPRDNVLFSGLRVRMGVHRGVPVCNADPVSGRMDYFGPAVNRAARIGSAGHGGQIVIGLNVAADLEAAAKGAGPVDEFAAIAASSSSSSSSKIPEEGQDAEPDAAASGSGSASLSSPAPAWLAEVSVVSLGEHELKGLDYPEVLSEVKINALPRTFGQVSTLTTSLSARARFHRAAAQRQALRSLGPAADVLLGSSHDLAVLAFAVDGIDKLWARDPETAPIIIGQLEKLLDKAAEEVRNPGSELSPVRVDWVGDAGLFVFPSAGDAVRFALLVQELIVDDEWPEGAGEHVPDPRRKGSFLFRGPRLRMGLEAGPVERASGRIVGRTAAFAISLAGAAQGGQVLVSKSVRTVAAMELQGTSARVLWKDLGVHELRGLSDEEDGKATWQIFEARSPALDRTFGDIRSITAGVLKIDNAIAKARTSATSLAKAMENAGTSSRRGEISLRIHHVNSFIRKAQKIKDSLTLGKAAAAALDPSGASGASGATAAAAGEAASGGSKPAERTKSQSAAAATESFSQVLDSLATSDLDFAELEIELSHSDTVRLDGMIVDMEAERRAREIAKAKKAKEKAEAIASIATAASEELRTRVLTAEEKVRLLQEENERYKAMIAESSTSLELVAVSADEATLARRELEKELAKVKAERDEAIRKYEEMPVKIMFQRRRKSTVQ
jgi:class 3 adenylate cyclase